MGTYSIDFYYFIQLAVILPMKVPPEEKKQRNSNLNLGRKRQNSALGTSSFCREVTTGSTYPPLSSEMVSRSRFGIYCSGFIFDKHQLEFETLDFEICQRNHEDNSGRFQEKDQFLGRDSIQKTNVQYFCSPTSVRLWGTRRA